MKHVGKRKVLISAVAMLLVLALTGAALAGSYPSPAFVLPGVKDRPQQTSAPEITAAPEATEAPEQSADPEPTAAPDVTPAPEATEDPEVHIDLEPTAEPEVTVEPEATVAPEATVEPEVTATPEATVTPETGVTLEPAVEPEPSPTVTPAPANTIIYQRDEAGNLVLDQNGNPIPVVPEGMHAPAAYQRDENGALVLDENGNPIPAEAPEATVEPEATPANTITYQRDEAGNLVLDENGNPIAILPEGATEMPVRFQRDANGNLILDENGNPIPIATVPVGAQKLDTLEDRLDPNRTIDIYANWGGGQLFFGDEATLVAVLNGYDNAIFTAQWQQSKDNVNWENVPNGNGLRCRVIVDESNYLNYWRIEVTVTGTLDDAQQ